MNKLISILLLIPCLTAAQYQQDSLHVRHLWYQTTAFKTLAVPAALIGYGVIASGDKEFPLSSAEVQEWREKDFPHFTTNLDNYMPSASLVLMFGLDVAGGRSENNWLNQAVIFGLANALNGFATKEVKHLTAVECPDKSDWLSFPSAHTSSAFVAAEMLHQEYKYESVWISVAGYSMAGAVGALRVLNNRHWLSDVVAGAAFGMLSVRVTYLIYPIIKRKLCQGRYTRNTLSDNK